MSIRDWLRACGLLTTAVVVGCAPRIAPGPVSAQLDLAPVELKRSSGDDAGLAIEAYVPSAGSGHDPTGAEGLAAWVLEARARGVEPAVEGVGGRVIRFATTRYALFKVSCPHKQGAVCVEALADFLAPREALDWEGARTGLLEALDRDATRPQSLARRALRRVVYEGHRHGHASRGRRGALEVLTPETATRWAEEHYVRRAIRVVVRGREADKLEETLREGLLRVPTGPVPEGDTFGPPPWPEGARVWVDADLPVALAVAAPTREPLHALNPGHGAVNSLEEGRLSSWQLVLAAAPGASKPSWVVDLWAPSPHPVVVVGPAGTVAIDDTTWVVSVDQLLR